MLFDKNKKTITGVVLKWLFRFTFVVIMLVTILYAIIEFCVYRYASMPEMIDVSKYSDSLKNDDFDAIPLHRMNGSPIIILDENNKTIFNSDDSVNLSFTTGEIECIPDYDSKDFYEVSVAKNNKRCDYIVEKYEIIDSRKVIMGYLFLDKNYNVLRGSFDDSVFENRSSFTKNEFEFLRGNFSDKYDIVKDVYENNNGKKRTIIMLMSKNGWEEYSQKSAALYRCLWSLVPMVILTLIAFSFALSAKMKKYINPLKEAISSVSERKLIAVPDDDVPYEIKEIINNFNDLTIALNESERNRQDLDAENQRMLTDISHDLKTPITVIQGYSKAICDGTVADETKGKYIEIINKKAESVSMLVDSFFEYSKMQHPDFNVYKQRCDICEFCRTYFAEKYQELDLGGYELEIDIPEKEVFCHIDPSLFKRVLENIVSNTVKYNPNGVPICFSVKERAVDVKLTIADKGVGIPYEMENELFKPFYTGDSARTSGVGTGLGMAIVYKNIDAHNGSVRLVVPPSNNYSTEFEIIIPK